MPRFASRRGTSRRTASGLVLVSCMFALVFVAYGIYPAYIQGQQNLQASQTISQQFGSDLQRALKPVLIISVYKSSTDHTLIHKYVDKNDLILAPVLSFFEAWFGANSLGGAVQITATDTGGGSRTFDLTDTSSLCTSSAQTVICNTTLGLTGSTIQLGTGVCVPARTDTALCSPFQVAVGTGQAGYSTTTGNVTMSSTIVSSSTATISETGMIMNWGDSGGSLRNVLFFHDSFSGFGVVNGNVIVIQYVLELNNTGFTNAFGEALALIFSSVTTSQRETNPYPNVLDTGGNSEALPIQYAETAVTFLVQPSSVDTPIIQIGIGSAAVARSQNSLATSTCSTNKIQEPITTLATSTLILQAGVSCPSPQTIREADLIQYMPALSGTVYFMVWRATFTGVPVGAGATIGVSWNLIFNTILPSIFCIPTVARSCG